MTRFAHHNIAGAGIGLRSPHYAEILETRPPVPWFEVLTDNYLGAGGLPLYHLEQVRKHYPVTLHGVGMSLGSTDPLDLDYLSKLRALAERIEPAWVSDHLAWISAGGRYVHDLLPLPYTRECLRLVTDRLNQAQEFLGRRLVIENPSSYLSFAASEMTEAEFLAALTEATGCELLFDVNNAYVSGTNHGFDPRVYLEALPAEQVREIHLAGYEEQNELLFDTHGYRVHPPVWDLYRAAIARFGPVATLIEWDTDIPDFAVLADEARMAQSVMDEAA